MSPKINEYAKEYLTKPSDRSARLASRPHGQSNDQPQGLSAHVSSSFAGITGAPFRRNRDTSVAGDSPSSSSPPSSVNSDGRRYIQTSAHHEPQASNPGAVGSSLASHAVETVTNARTASHHTSGEIPSSAGLMPSTYDSTRLALSFDEVMEKIRAPLMDIFMMHLHEHEVAQEAKLATFEKRLIEKVEVGQERFQGEVLAQKHALSAARAEVSRLGAQVSQLQTSVAELGEITSSGVSTEHLDDVWNEINVIKAELSPSRCAFPEHCHAADQPQGSLSFRNHPPQFELKPTHWIDNPAAAASPPSGHDRCTEYHSAQSHNSSGGELSNSVSLNPNSRRSIFQDVEHVAHEHVPAAPSRSIRNIPRVTEIDHGGPIPFRMGIIYAGATRVPLEVPQLSVPHRPSAAQQPRAQLPPPPQASEGISRSQHSHAVGPPPGPPHGQQGSHRVAPAHSSGHDPQPSASHAPSTSTSILSYDVDQSHKINLTKNALDTKSVPIFFGRKGLIAYHQYAQPLFIMISTQGASEAPVLSRLNGKVGFLSGSMTQSVIGDVDKLSKAISRLLTSERRYRPYPPGPHQFWQAWAYVTHRYLSEPLPEEYHVWSSSLKMGLSNAIDTRVDANESVREFAVCVLHVYDLFDQADPAMFAHELERFPILHVFKAGLPANYLPKVADIMQNLVVRTMDRTKQLSHLISQLQNYHEYVVSEKCGDAHSPATPGNSVDPSSHASSQASPLYGYSRPVRRAAHPAAHITVINEDDSPFFTPDAEPKHAAHVTSYPDSHVDDEQDRVTSLQEDLVHAHSHATFPSTMHPRGNNRAPLPAAAPSQSFSQRPPGATGADGPASSTSSQTYGVPGAGTGPSVMICDICKSKHWTRNCPRFPEAMSVYSKYMKDNSINPDSPVPVTDTLVSHNVYATDKWSGFPTAYPSLESSSRSGSGESVIK
ncbi:hypothetical protein CEUSTIGMA_g3584.t1 [Chlamydomonas eustigma]|uniref:Uncharacterized protein n=1 Tax=Chlamydomonas eustigma TaxID=1157962 RepID=A0A250WZ88_9CHLO|nr:hypothetical protein CEUSTIGMA_g3584.t1 [Chlamydomonas eustigma]|eukprot:GAX76141.1 hypothetical protein CEUSTIGMA_g3584.t1 [Chlamydomonas eustigma]